MYQQQKRYNTAMVQQLQTWHGVITKAAICSAIAQILRYRVRYSFGQKWKTGTRRQYFTNIIGLSSTTVVELAFWRVGVVHLVVLACFQGDD